MNAKKYKAIIIPYYDTSSMQAYYHCHGAQGTIESFDLPVAWHPVNHDEVSMIGSESDAETLPEASNSADCLPTDMMLRFEDLLRNSGDFNHPVVDIFYDLNMISDVLDPDLFFEELAQIKE